MSGKPNHRLWTMQDAVCGIGILVRIKQVSFLRCQVVVSVLVSSTVFSFGVMVLHAFSSHSRQSRYKTGSFVNGQILATQITSVITLAHRAKNAKTEIISVLDILLCNLCHYQYVFYCLWIFVSVFHQIEVVATARNVTFLLNLPLITDFMTYYIWQRGRKVSLVFTSAHWCRKAKLYIQYKKRR